MHWVGQTSGLARLVDYGSATLFAGAVGYSVGLLAWPVAGLAGAAIAFPAALGLLGWIDHRPTLAMPQFTLGDMEVAADELLLTDLAELLLTEALTSEDELLLEDRLDLPEADSRVIRLFDPRTIPTAGDLRDRIDHHLGRPSRAYSDATAELHEALTALKNSLR